MKLFVNISRILVGCLFIFSGLVKAIDPLGLAYKMQEFFEVWAADGYFKNLMGWLHEYATGFSIFMIALEVVLGVALLIGWQKRLTTWLLLFLTLFFTFLTSYVLFSGKIRACGCFGDCIPLTPIQTFTKDIILTVLIIIILIGQKYIQPLFKKVLGSIIVLLSLIAVLWLQFYVLKHLPIKDCLPYKIGNNILELRKAPKDATYDKFAYTYFYKKGNEEKDFDYGKQPDSTWIMDTTKQPNKKLLEKGNGKVALINDFSFTTENGNDTTEDILNKQGEYYLLFIKDIPKQQDREWVESFRKLYALNAHAGFFTVFVVTSAPVKEVRGLLNVDIPVFTCDGTAIKTAARANPTLFLMRGPVIQNKWSGADIKKIKLLGGFKGMTNGTH
jgi:uncharacterized membrane protein YphA (DoxX/SURF4 family)